MRHFRLVFPSRKRVGNWTLCVCFQGVDRIVVCLLLYLPGMMVQLGGVRVGAVVMVFRWVWKTQKPQFFAHLLPASPCVYSGRTLVVTRTDVPCIPSTSTRRSSSRSSCHRHLWREWRDMADEYNVGRGIWHGNKYNVGRIWRYNMGLCQAHVQRRISKRGRQNVSSQKRVSTIRKKSACQL